MKKRKKRLVSFIIGTLLFIAICFGIYFSIYKITSPSEKIKAIDTIKDYDYTLSARDTKIFEDNYYLLKETLSKSKVDEEKYAEYLSKLFIIDLYTISNKYNKNDVGGYEYVYPEYQETFKIKVKDTLYKYVGYNSKDAKKTPQVSSIKVKEIEETTFMINNEKKIAYEVSLSWEYVKDYDYDNQGIVTISSCGKKLCVVEYNQEGVQ